MTFEHGVLTAECSVEYPEAVERYLEDSSVHLLFTPELIDDECVQSMALKWRDRNKADRDEIKTSMEQTLSIGVPNLDDIQQVIASWVHSQRRLTRYRQFDGFDFDYVRGGGIKPHIDLFDLAKHRKRGPLSLSVCIGGEAVFSGDNSIGPLTGRLGLPHLRNRARNRELIQAYRAGQNIGDKIIMPAAVHQKTSDGVWIRTGNRQSTIHHVTQHHDAIPEVAQHVFRDSALFDCALTKD